MVFEPEESTDTETDVREVKIDRCWNPRRNDSSHAAQEEEGQFWEHRRYSRSDARERENDLCMRSRNGFYKSRETGTAKIPSVRACKLPKEVVEKIFAMIPFPYLLKVRALSKAWYNRFPLPSDRSGKVSSKFHPNLNYSNDVVKDASLSFQNLVSSVSWKWSVYCPVIVGDEGLIGYNPVHKLWQTLFTNLQQVLGTRWEPHLISSRGPLICGVSQSLDSAYDLSVTNVLTGRWRKLPSHPNKRVPSLLNLVFDAPDSYKVFLVTEDPYEGPYHDCSGNNSSRVIHRCLSSQVFDSTTGSWTISDCQVPTATSFAWRSCSVFYDGNFYCLAGDDRNPVDHPLQLWVHNLKEGIWTEIRHPFGSLVNPRSGASVVFDLTRFQLFVCDSKIMLVLALDPKELYEERIETDSLLIYELDPVTHRIKLQSSGPPATVLGNSEHITSDGTNICFCTLDLDVCCPVVVYNGESGQWSCLSPNFKTAGLLTNKRWADFAFQPGLNPFIAP